MAQSNPIIQSDCQKHVENDCYYGTFIPVLGLPLLASERCQKQLKAYDACVYAKDAGFLTDTTGGPPRAADGDTTSPWLVIIAAVVFLFLILKLVGR